MRRRLAAVVAALLVVSVLLWPAGALAATGNDVGANLSKLLRHYAGELYGGIVAVVGLVFLINRRYTELATFLVASVVVAWLVFSPGEIADAARAIGRQIF
jgi:nitrate reductase gamma subunit